MQDDDDRALLERLLPPEPREDWVKTVAVLEAEGGYLKTVFRFYTAQGSSSNESDALAKPQFVSFAKAIKVCR